MADDIGLPFNPLRSTLYQYKDLFDGFSPNQAASYANCVDLQIYQYFVRYGKNPTQNSAAGTLEALHDNSISMALQVLLGQNTRVVAIMGGHGLARDSTTYKNIAYLASALSREGFFLASGGGPGAMEATHLGALFSVATSKDLDDAIRLLSSISVLPDTTKLMDPTGAINPIVAGQLHKWFEIAYSIRAQFESTTTKLTTSIAIPTWLYGHEPTSPLATHIAKYFQNSVREDGLVTLGRSGIIYTEGRAGTVQEIFQDAAQNYYATDNDFRPMVFWGNDYWSKKLPIKSLIEALLGSKKNYSAKVLFTDNQSEIVTFLSKQV